MNNHSHIDKYSMKEITKCIGNIGHANWTLFPHWTLLLDFGRWVTSPMGQLGCTASFQRLMETVLRNVKNVLVYINDLSVHTSNHEEHLAVLEKVF